MKISGDIIFETAIDILNSKDRFHIELGLDRCQNILAILGNPEKKLSYIHVAGTNGKGSVCAILSAILTQATTISHSSTHILPTKVGLFTSPHIFEYTERIKINDVNIDKEVFGEKIIKITKLADEHNIYLTEFEIITVTAFDYFAKNKVDVVILETGLGGRLDATNIIKKNICSIITNITLDHTERLGNTIEKIAYEKAGIIKKNCPVIINSHNNGLTIINKIARITNSQVIYSENSGKQFTEFLLLKGKYQAENLGLALKTIEVLDEKLFAISEGDIKVGLKNVNHPFRFEYLAKEHILIDGAHNPNGTKALRESLDYYYPNQKFKFIFGCLQNKNYLKMMENLFKERDEIYFYQFDNENASSYQELAIRCQFDSKPFSKFKNDMNTLTVICGSFYMIKELLEKMGIK